ncbi:MAG TPA: hypothetical protein VFO55_14275 [Gemmatimonadaceae bacterium]|nr:hypothetical protein [Gemmatimonadaceae bacterium]
MKNVFRRLGFAAIVASAAVMLLDRPLRASAGTDLCTMIACSKGARKCADLYLTAPDERCEEGVMCCPFPEETSVQHCYESALET